MGEQMWKSRSWKPPRALCVNLTQACNLKCRTCFNWRNRNVFPEGYHLALKNFLYQYSRYVSMPYLVVFAGAETLMYPKLGDVLQYCASLGYETQVVTNGILLEKEIVEEFRVLGVKAVTLPLEGVTKEVHNSLRPYGGKHFDMVQSKIEMLENLYPELHLHINSVITDLNYRESLNLAQWVNEHPYIRGIYFNILIQPFGTSFDPEWYKSSENGFQSIWFSDIEAVVAVVDSLREMRLKGAKIDNAPEQFEAFARYLKQPLEFVHEACPIPGHGMILKPAGELCYCPHFRHHLGNILHDDLQEILDSDEILEHMQFIAQCKNNCHLAVNCFFKPFEGD